LVVIILDIIVFILKKVLDVRTVLKKCKCFYLQKFIIVRAATAVAPATGGASWSWAVLTP